MPARKRLLATAAPVVLALALAGCSGGSDDEWTQSRPNGTFSPSADSTGAAAAATASAGPVPTAKGATVSGASLAARIDAALPGAKAAAFSIVVTGPQPSSANGVTAGTGNGLKLQMKSELSTMSKVEIIKTDGVVYLKPPSALASGKEWLKVTDKQNDPYRPFYTALFASLENSADVGKTAGIIGQIGTFTAGAAETVDGVKTIKYSATPPAGVGVKLLPASFQQLDASSLAKSKAALAVWIDAGGLVRRVATQLTLPTTQTQAKAKSLVSYTGWGQKITVQAPPASHVISPTPAS